MEHHALVGLSAADSVGKSTIFEGMVYVVGAIMLQKVFSNQAQPATPASERLSKQAGHMQSLMCRHLILLLCVHRS